LPATPINTLLKAKKIAEDAGCNYVYMGNVPEIGSENTICPKCKKVIIERKGYSILQQNLKNNECLFCGSTIKEFGNKNVFQSNTWLILAYRSCFPHFFGTPSITLVK
jgi:pyruvate formate lyase activating enzyme